MLFYLTTLNSARFLIKNAHALDDDEINDQVVVVVEVWKHFDFYAEIMSSMVWTKYYIICIVPNRLLRNFGIP